MDTQTLITTTAQKFKIDPELVSAFCSAESAYNPLAVRFEPAYHYLVAPALWAKKVSISADTEMTFQKCSWGMMQVMGGVARDLGYKETLVGLTVADIGLMYGCMKLKKCMDKYPANLIFAIASYNAGSPRFNTNGDLVNKAYVDKVLSKYNDLKKKR